MASLRRISLRAITGIGEVQPGQPLGQLVNDALDANGVRLVPYDVVVVCQKIVSKAEGRFVRLADVQPSDQARDLARVCGKDARYVEAVLRESTAVVRCAPGVLIVRHRLGMVMANAGIDQSNIEDGDAQVLLLPEDPDRSAQALRDGLLSRHGVLLGVLITDSFGRAWRQGVCGVCVGSAGVLTLQDQRGRMDRHGRALRITQVAVADQIAAAAGLLMGEADEGLPVIVASGVAGEHFSLESAARDLIRPESEDLFK